MDDITLMRLALAEAEKAAALGEVPVGAVVAKDGEPVAVAHNTRETGKNATHHAELLAIDAACRALGGWRLWQCELFVTLEPCPMCAGAIVNSRIKRVVYGARDAKAGCCGSVTDLFALPFNHRPQVEGGLLEDECAALLAAFFEELRRRRREGSKPKWKKPQSCQELPAASAQPQRWRWPRRGAVWPCAAAPGGTVPKAWRLVSALRAARRQYSVQMSLTKRRCARCLRR